MAVPGAVRAHYLKEIGALIERYRRELGASGIDYQLVDTNQPLEIALLSYLSTRSRSLLMLSFLSPLFLAGAAAAAVPIVLHLLKREPEARVKFAAVKLIKQAPVEHTDKRRLRELLLLALRITALLLLALAFARPFFATGAAVGSTGVTVVALDTLVQPVGAGALRAREAAGEGGVGQGAGRRPRRRRHLRRRSGDCREAGSRPHAGRSTRSSRRRPVSARRAIAPRSRPHRSTSPAAAARSSSSPICRRAGGTPATARRCREGRRFRSPMSARCRRTSRSPPCGRWPIGSSPRFTTAARVRATRACICGSTAAPPATRRVSLGAKPVGRRGVCRRAARRVRGGQRRRCRGNSGGQRALCRASAARAKPSVLVVTGIRRRQPRRVLPAARAGRRASRATRRSR